MTHIGIIREGKSPADNRVALTPAQCRWLLKNIDCTITVQPSPTRCFKDEEYVQGGVILQEDLSNCDILFGIKEVPTAMLLKGKTYLFFSHTIKKQPYNKKLMQAMVANDITLIDYECLKHKDGQRIIGFGFFAGIVGAHNGISCFGKRTGAFNLTRVYKQKDYAQLIHGYFGLKLPPIKIAVTGSGRVAHGILEIMNLMDVQEVEPDEYISTQYEYPVYVHLKGADLYAHKKTKEYNRTHFHSNPSEYESTFSKYLHHTDILMNGIFWDKDVPRLFELADIKNPEFKMNTIADITDDQGGSVPCNLGDGTIEDPVYGVNRFTLEKTLPFDKDSIDMMAVGNLPNELPRDASRFFGEQLIKYILGDIINGGSDLIDRATILKQGKLTDSYTYLTDYAAL